MSLEGEQGGLVSLLQLKISFLLNPNPSLKSASNPNPLPPALQIHATSSMSMDSSKGSENGGGSNKSTGSGMIVGMSRKRAQLFFNAVRKEWTSGKQA